MPAGRAECGQCRAWCDSFYGYHIFWSLLCHIFFTLTACLFPSMDPQARTCVTSYFDTHGVEILNEMGGAGEQAKCLPWP